MTLNPLTVIRMQTTPDDLISLKRQFNYSTPVSAEVLLTQFFCIVVDLVCVVIFYTCKTDKSSNERRVTQVVGPVEKVSLAAFKDKFRSLHENFP